MKNYYKLLQVDPEAEPEVIEAAFRRLALKYHPDVNREEATARMQALNEAWYVLRDPDRRRAYNAIWIDQEPGSRVVSQTPAPVVEDVEELPPTVFRSYWQAGQPEQEDLTKIFAFIALVAMVLGIVSSILLYLVYI